jgi:hypothetical protein
VEPAEVVGPAKVAAPAWAQRRPVVSIGGEGGVDGEGDVDDGVGIYFGL